MKMIKLSDDHYIVGDDSEIKVGDWYYDTNDKESLMPIYQRSQDPKFYSGCKKITHSTNIDWNEVYYIPLSEVKELLGEDTDVWSRKLEYLKKVNENIKHKSQDERIWIFGASDLGFTAGYKQALEDNKDKVSLKDLKRFLAEGRYTISKDLGGNITADFTELISLLTSPKTEWDVEFVDGRLKLKK